MKNEDAEFDPVADLHERQRRIRQEMGGADRVAKMKKDGVPTIRDHIEGLLDQGTFRELGTHSRSMRLEDRLSTPCDGKVGGEGEINGKSVYQFIWNIWRLKWRRWSFGRYKRCRRNGYCLYS